MARLWNDPKATPMPIYRDEDGKSLGDHIRSDLMGRFPLSDSDEINALMGVIVRSIGNYKHN